MANLHYKKYDFTVNPLDILINFTNTLNENQLKQINLAIEACAKNDNYIYECPTDSSLNNEDLPCFFIAYHGDIIISFICVYSPDNEFSSLYGFTIPQYRNQGIFSYLLGTLLTHYTSINNPIHKLEQFNIPIYADNFTDKIKNILNHLGFNHFTNELLMCKNICKVSNNDSNKNINKDFSVISNKHLSLEFEHNQYGNEYSLWKDDIYLGGCLIDYSGKTVTLYEFGIIDEYQGKGYGKILLNLIINDLILKSYKKIILQVSGDNKKAISLYLGCGFKITSELRYYTN